MATNYETLTVRADAGGERTTAPRGTNTVWIDGYEQDTYQGLQPTKKNISFVYTGSYAEVKAVNDFIERNVKLPFWYSFDKSEPLDLYKLDGNFTFTHVGGLTWRVTAQFKEYTGL